MELKYQSLQKNLRSLGSAAVAFSSGVDSTFLLRAAHDVLGDKAIAVTAKSCSFPERELREAGLTKGDIRQISRELGLPTWNKQSFACLSSRFVYGETIGEEKLGMVDKAEQLLLDLGFHQVRVRIHGKIARIEIGPEEFPKMLEETVRRTVYDTCKGLGFTYVALDLGGYRTGSMNETLGVSFQETCKTQDGPTFQHEKMWKTPGNGLNTRFLRGKPLAYC